MQRTDEPLEPVISESECYAALYLMRLMCDNICSHGDVSEEIVQLVDEFRKRVYTLKAVSSGADSIAVGALIATGLVPSFQRSSEDIAGINLLRLIAARQSAGLLQHLASLPI